MKLFLANQMENIPSQEETMLGVLDHDVVCSSLEALTNKKKRKNSTFSEEERCQIGQYASVHGPTTALKKVQENPSPFEVRRKHH